MSTDVIDIPLDVEKRGQECIEFYVSMIEKGESAKMAELLACRQPPGANTDREFFSGRNTLAQQFDKDPRGLATLIKAAKKNGYTPRANDVYESGLCRPGIGQGDPEAFISSSDGRSGARKILERRGWAAEGSVRVKPGMSRLGKKKALSSKAINRFRSEHAKIDPYFARAHKREQVAEVIKKHGCAKLH